jgi:hypothetical protein
MLKEDETKYVVKVNGVVVSPMYGSVRLAEDAIRLLTVEHQSIAEVVPVTVHGQEILLG